MEMPERINAGQILVVVGAVALFVSLFLNWYEAPFEGSVTAWTAFELLDIVLAGLALAAIAAVVPIPRDEWRAPLISSDWIPWFGVAALVFILVSLVNDPPAAAGLGLDIGVWIGLAGAAVVAIGGVMSFARISVVIGTGTEQDTEDMEPLSEEPLPGEEPLPREKPT
jgi:hypothetical protein